MLLLAVLLVLLLAVLLTVLLAVLLTVLLAVLFALVVLGWPPLPPTPLLLDEVVGMPDVLPAPPLPPVTRSDAQLIITVRPATTSRE